MGKLKKVEGSSLIEVLVSLVIISVILGISGLLIDTAWSLGTNIESQKANYLSFYRLNNELVYNDSVTVTLKTKHAKFPEASVLTVIILTPQGDTISERRKIISHEEKITSIHTY